MQGYSGSYAVNGVNFILSPTTGRWSSRDSLGIDGNGHPIYPSVREFELRWGLAHPTDVEQFIQAYNSVSNTGTIAFDLPEYGNLNYLFKTYSGTTLSEPEFDDYFEGYIKDVRLTIHNIRT